MTLKWLIIQEKHVIYNYSASVNEAIVIVSLIHMQNILTESVYVVYI